MASGLGENGILDSGTKIAFYRDRDDFLIRFFTMEDGFVYCNNIQGLLLEMGLPVYKSNEWRLFINSFKRKLKCVILNGKCSLMAKFACVPIRHSVIVKEHYLNVKMVWQKLSYNERNWTIGVDFKMVNILVGQQVEYTKHPRFLCFWDSSG